MSTRDLARKLWPVMVLLIIAIIWYVAKYHPPYGKLVCEYESAPGDPHAEYIYTSTFNFWRVKEIETTEIITSNSKETLNRFKEAAEYAQSINKDKKHYKMDISLEGKKLTSITTINYKKMTDSEYASINGSKKKTLYVNSVKKTYQKIGANCKYK